MTKWWVYRSYDAAGSLLYVGCTLDLHRRMRTHQLRSPWYVEHARLELSGPFIDPVEAHAVEDEQIWGFGPIYNRPRLQDYRQFGLDFWEQTGALRPYEKRDAA